MLASSLHEHTATAADALVCGGCRRAILPGRSYFAEWTETPSPDDADSVDFLADPDVPVFCSGCVATERVLDDDPYDPGGSLVFCASCGAMSEKHAGILYRCFCGSRSYRFDAPPPDLPAPVPADGRRERDRPYPPPLPPRRRRFPRSLLVLAVVAVVAVLGFRHMQADQGGCPSGTRYDAQTFEIACARPDGSTQCLLSAPFGSPSAPMCPGKREGR
jgi:hypothetical protein